MFDPISAIKSRLSIEELVSRYVQLKKSGRNYKALCPFHKEKTPSFIISPDKGLAYCFGCQRGGDIFRFIQEIEGVDFSGAVTMLAERTGVELTKRAPSVSRQKKDILFSIHEQAASFFERLLFESSGGESVRFYLKERGMNDETIKKFHLGFAPDSFEETTRYLSKKGFSPAEIVEAGIAIARDTEGRDVFDRFRMRLMFPIRDNQGRIIAFGGRVLRDADEPKYLNSPDTPIYHKSEAIFGFYEAKNSIRDCRKVVIVEGYMDVLASVQAGVSQTVAVSGTALTDEHIRGLKRFSDEFVLGFDADEAGDQALFRAVEMLQPYDLNIRIVRPFHGKDPGECAVSSPETWRDHVASALSYMQYYLGYYRECEKAGRLSRKQISSFIIPMIVRVPNRIERDQYVKDLAVLFEVSPGVIYDEISRLAGLSKRITKPLKTTVSSVSTSDEKITDSSSDSSFTLSPDLEYLISLLLEFPDVISSLHSHIQTIVFSLEDQAVLTRFFSSFNQKGFLEELDPKARERLKIKMLWFETYHPDWTDDQVISEVKKVVDRLKDKQYDKRRRELIARMVQARKLGQRNKEQELFEEYAKMVESD